jgi:hypothetical protein
MSDQMEVKMRRVILSALAFGLLAVSVVWGGAPASATSTQCKTSHAHWAVTEGGVSIRIAWIEMYLEACTDGRHLTSTAAWTDSGMTGPGIAAGFVFSLGSPHRTSFSDQGFGGGEAGYTAKGTAKNCANHWVRVFCSPTEDYQVHVHLTMASQLYTHPPGTNWWTINGRYFLFVFTAKCTNDACGLHFHH